MRGDSPGAWVLQKESESFQEKYSQDQGTQLYLPRHDRHRGDMSNRSDCGGTMPGHAEETAKGVQQAEQHNVPVQAGTLLEATLGLIHNEFRYL